MAITNFIPELWSANILLELQKNLVYGSAVNRDYEGDIANYGDTVNINYVGSVNNVEFTGGSAENYDLTLGSGTFIDGFEDQIIGHKPGETFDVNVTFPDGYSDSTDASGNAVKLSGRLYRDPQLHQ